MEQISKNFGKRPALDNVEFISFPGEIHSLVGENGAGKTTLMRVLNGLVVPDEGNIRIRGKAISILTPSDARKEGVGMVHQESLLIPAHTVLENLCLGNRFASKGNVLPYGKVRIKLKELRDKTGLWIKEDRLIEELSIGERQKVGILKLLLRDPEILIFDEPTSVLVPQEVAELMSLFRRLSLDGKTVIFITHKLNEVIEISDRITVLKQGQVVCRTVPEETDVKRLSKVMVGEEVGTNFANIGSIGTTVAKLISVKALGVLGEKKLMDVNLVVRRGEMVGIAGVEGNGQQELAEILSGLRRPDGGIVKLPSEIGFIPDDRGGEALIGSFSVSENVALGLVKDGRFRWGPTMLWGKIEQYVKDLILRYGITATNHQQKVAELSGGNQQKVVLARELKRSQDLLIARNPTQGLDVKASRFFYKQMMQLLGRDSQLDATGQPAGIVLISSDLEEILTFANKIYVIYNGGLIEVKKGEVSKEFIGRLMLMGQRAGLSQ
jgi:ABC-type uncharacterized transport system ATPase subunit